MRGGLRRAGTCLPARLGGEKAPKSSAKAAGGRGRLCCCRDKMAPWCETAQQETDGQSRELVSWGCKGMQAEQREKKQEPWSGPRRSRMEKELQRERHKSLSRARRSVSRRMSPGPGRIDSFLQQPARKKCFIVLQDTDSSQLMFLRVLH